MPSAIDTYETLFRAAQQDVHGIEKVAISMPGGGAWLKNTANKATDMLSKGRKQFNNLPGVRDINESQLGQRFSHMADSHLNSLRGRFDDMNVVGAGQAARNKRHSQAVSDWDKRFNQSTTPDQRQWAQEMVEKDVKATKKKDPGTWGDEIQRRYSAQKEQLSEAQQKAQSAQRAAQEAREEAQGKVSPWTAAGVGAAGAGTAGTGAYMYGTHKAEEEGRRNRNLAFGSGLAAGAAAPKVYEHIRGAARSAFGPPPQNNRIQG